MDPELRRKKSVNEISILDPAGSAASVTSSAGVLLPPQSSMRMPETDTRADGV